MSRADDNVSGLEATVAPTEPPSRPSGLEATMAPTLDATMAPTDPPTEPQARPSGLDVTVAPTASVVGLASGPRAAVDEAADLDAKLTVVDPKHYKMLGEFARGGLGRIVRARDRRTGRLVAIKEMLGSSSEIGRRFMREAVLTANLQHPAIVPVYELGRWPTGDPFYAMKLVDGRSFEDVLANAKSLDQRIALLPTLVAVADALAYAHQEKIIHRDLKPANVLVGTFGETVVIDWGLAKRVSDEGDDDETFAPTVTPLPTQAAENQTVAGSVMGTPAYMPPEQARGDDLDPRADVYALGAILYHLLSGGAPFSSRRPKHVHELLDMVEKEVPPRLETLVPEAPADLIAIVVKAMARDRDARYPTAKELADDLQRFTTGQLVGAHTYDRWTLFKRWLRRNRAAVSVGGVLLAILAVVAVVSVRSIVRERNRAEAESEAAQANLAVALAEKGDAAEKERQWGRAAMYYQASLALRDDARNRFAAGRAEARTIASVVKHTGHAGRIQGLAIDGDTALTVDDVGEVRRWRLADGTLIASWRAPTPLHAIAVRPGGGEVAIGGDDGIVRILTPGLVSSGELRHHTRRIYTIAYSPDGRLLASGSFDADIVISGDRGEPPVKLAGHSQRVYSIAFSPDGTRIASASDDRTARIWDLQGHQLQVITGHTAGGVKVVAWFPDGERLLSSGWDRTLRLWNIRTGTSLLGNTGWEDSASVHAGTVAVNGRLVVTGGSNKVVKVWDPATQSLVAHLDGHADQVSAVAATADGKWLVSASHDKTARVWDLGAAARLAQLGHQRAIRRLAWTGDGAFVVTTALDNTLRIWNADSGREEFRSTSPYDCIDGASTLGNDVIAAGCSDGNVHRWRLRDRTPLPELIGSKRRLRHAVSPPDESWIAAGHTDGWVEVWDPRGASRASKQIHGHHIYGMRALADGTLLTASLDNTVRKSTPALDPIAIWRAPGIDGLLDGAIDPKGRFVVAGGDGFDVFRWDAAHPDRAADVLHAHTGTVWSVDVSPDGATVATASSDGTIRLWDTASWQAPGYQPRVLQGPRGGVLVVAFSPDGSKLASGHQRGAAIVWDHARGVPLRRLGASEAGEEGTCADLERVPWNDPLEKAIILRACLEPAGLGRLGARTHLKMADTGVDLVERWE